MASAPASRAAPRISTARSNLCPWLAETSAIRYAGRPGPMGRPPISKFPGMASFPGRSGPLPVGELEAEVDPAPALLEVCPGIGPEGPGSEDVDQFPCPILPVQVDGVDPLDVPRPVMGPSPVLRRPRRPPVPEVGPVFLEELHAGRLELTVEALAGVDGLDRHLPPRDEVSRIHPFVEVVKARPRRSALDDAPDVGVLAAVVGQIGGMNVHAAPRQRRDDLGGEEVTEKRRHSDLGPERADGLRNPARAERRAVEGALGRDAGAFHQLLSQLPLRGGMQHEPHDLLSLLPQPCRHLPAHPVVGEEQDPHPLHRGHGVAEASADLRRIASATLPAPPPSTSSLPRRLIARRRSRSARSALAAFPIASRETSLNQPMFIETPARSSSPAIPRWLSARTRSRAGSPRKASSQEVLPAAVMATSALVM